MSTETIIETEPVLDGPPSQWPPIAHIFPKDEVLKKGSIAMCGAKLMGIDLGHLNSPGEVCEKCKAEVLRRGYRL